MSGFRNCCCKGFVTAEEAIDAYEGYFEPQSRISSLSYQANASFSIGSGADSNNEQNIREGRVGSVPMIFGQNCPPVVQFEEGTYDGTSVADNGKRSIREAFTVGYFIGAMAARNVSDSNHCRPMK